MKKMMDLSSKYKNRFYSYVKLLLWASAFVSMSVLTFLDCFQLVSQYNENSIATNVIFKDNSSNGMRLPNATVCINFNDYKIKSRRHMLRMGEPKLTKFKQLLKLRHAEYLTTRFNLDYYDKQDRMREKVIWNSIMEQLRNYTVFDSEIQNIYKDILSISTPESREVQSIQNSLSEWFCNTINAKFFITDGMREIDFNICQLAKDGRIPFDQQTNNFDFASFCFRIPMDKIVINDQTLLEVSSIPAHSLTEDIIQQRVVLQFSPMSLLKVYPTPPNGKNIVSVIIFFPEIPMSYGEMRMNDLLWQSSKSQFFHRMIYPQDFGLMRKSIFKVDISVNSKYKRIDDNPTCIDPYDQTPCVVACMEENFSLFCGCHRTIFRHFVEEHAVKPFCDEESYKKCELFSADVRGFQNFTLYKHKGISECVSECSSKCWKINFSTQVTEVQKRFAIGSESSKTFCKIFMNVANQDKNESCAENILKNINDHPYEIDEVYQELQKISKRNLTNNEKLLEREMFGTVEFCFAIKSFNYPEFKEVEILVESLFSQIGGIFGLYLGLSGFTCFIVTIKFLKVVKKRWHKKPNDYHSNWFIFQCLNFVFNCKANTNEYQHITEMIEVYRTRL